LNQYLQQQTLKINSQNDTIAQLKAQLTQKQGSGLNSSNNGELGRKNKSYKSEREIYLELVGFQINCLEKSEVKNSFGSGQEVT